MADVTFTEAEWAACKKFCREVEAFLDQESARHYGNEKDDDSATKGNAGPLVLSRQR
jgi:hypothetical protein